MDLTDPIAATETIYGDTTVKRLTPAGTAVYVRARLKADFPGIKFSVRSERYSGGASIRIRWTDGPSVQAVEKSCSHFERSWFDGMTDMRHYKDNILLLSPEGDLELVAPGVDYVNGDRDISPQFQTALIAYATVLVRQQAGEQFDLDTTYTTAFATEWGLCPSHYSGHALVSWLSRHLDPPAPAAASAPASSRTRKPRQSRKTV